MIGICGASGYIGRALFEYLVYHNKTVLGTYCHNPKPGMVRFDLLKSNFDIFDNCKFVVVSAAYAKIKFCQENSLEAYRLNVYMTKKLLKHLHDKGIPSLFISSDATIKPELMQTNYGKYKRMVEEYIERNSLNCAISRPGKITKDNVKELCEDICAQMWAYKGRKE